ncbi:MAG: LPS-assembly protein LptD [Betaproteobacteria bacterium]|nr:LPS-assembly protein LptD [Betaproteobacteria bacterium]
MPAEFGVPKVKGRIVASNPSPPSLASMSYRPRVLAACAAAAFASSAMAEELGLKLDRPGHPDLKAHSASSEEDSPFLIEADRLAGYQTGEFHAQGDVKLSGRGMQAWADDLFGSLAENELSGSGHVKIDRGGDVITGSRFFFDTDTNSGYIEEPTYYIKQYGARGWARRAEFAGQDRFQATKAIYTTCELGHDDWYLKVSQLDIDRTRDIGEARNATLRFKEVPILYSPWLDFPVGSKRKTGLLAPSIGTTQKGGFEITTPLYLDLAPNYDATVSPRFMSKRGLLLKNELRYLNRSFSGELHAEYLPDDLVINDSRYGLAFKHTHDLGGGFSASLNLNKVSDDQYFIDLSDKISVTSLTNLPREASLAYNGGWWNAGVRTQRFQTLQDPLAPVVPPYARVPQVTLNASRANVQVFALNFQGEVAAFRHPTQVEVVRQLYYPSVQIPLDAGYFTFTPKVGLHHRRYNFTSTAQEDETRTLPVLSLDSTVIMERDATLFGQAFLQTLEPRLYYVYIPYEDQSKFPLLDTAVADFNFGQIFTENQFSGADRLNDANQLTAAVTSRLLDSESGEERLRAVLGQRYYFKSQQVTLNNQVREFNRSDVLAVLNGKLTRDWSVDSVLQYDINNGQAQKLSVVFRYQPEAGKAANFGYRFQQDTLKTLDISSQWPLSRQWTGLARWNYSLQARHIVEGLAGLEYNAGCWAVRMVAHRFATATSDLVKSFFVQLEFTGLTGLGSNPLDVLRQNITGYTKTTDLPNKGTNP